MTQRTFSRQTAPHIVAYAVQGLAVACVTDAPARLVTLLRECIADTAELTAPPHPPPPKEKVESVWRARAAV